MTESSRSLSIFNQLASLIRTLGDQSATLSLHGDGITCCANGWQQLQRHAVRCPSVGKRPLKRTLSLPAHKLCPTSPAEPTPHFSCLNFPWRAIASSHSLMCLPTSDIPPPLFSSRHQSTSTFNYRSIIVINTILPFAQASPNSPHSPYRRLNLGSHL